MHSGAPSRFFTRDTRLFWCVTVALLALFGLVQVHELIPWLHHDADDHLPGDYCPFCIIKCALTFAVAVYVTLCMYPRMRCSVTQPPGLFTPLLIALSFPARAPPSPLPISGS